MNKELNRIFEEKFAPVLEQWAITFKLMGSPSETPRYSQIQAFRGGRDNTKVYPKTPLVWSKFDGGREGVDLQRSFRQYLMEFMEEIQDRVSIREPSDH